jgi:excisionase family DNA binding protein
MKPLLTIEEAAALLGVKTQTLYLWVSQRRIPFRKIGRLVRFTETDLEEFIEKRKQPPLSLENGALSTR